MTHQPTATTIAPLPLIERALFELGQSFVGSYAQAFRRTQQTHLCRSMLAVAGENRAWVIQTLRFGASVARGRNAVLRRVAR